LKDGDIYISKIDYNIENGNVTYPIVPVFRVSTPIYIKNKFRGVLTINTFAKKIYRDILKLPNIKTIILMKMVFNICRWTNIMIESIILKE